MLVAGSNLFGHWQVDRGCSILNSFQAPHLIKNAEVEHSFNPSKSKLVYVGWSYNIFSCEGKFYVTGLWNEKDNQVVHLPLPKECENITNTKFTMVGNGHSIILINTTNPSMWIFDFEKDCYKKMNFAIEKPVDNLTESVKKIKKDDSIVKSVITNTSGLFLTADGQVYWGLLPTLIDTSHCEGTVCDVQCGYEHFVLLTNMGKVYTWGNGRRLQLGHGELTSLDAPTLVEALAGIKIIKIRTGGWHTLALSEFGDLYSWGWNDIGQLGIKSSCSDHQAFKSQATPTLVDFYTEDKIVESNVKDIACGSRHSVALLEDNSVWTTGNNKYGQCGFPVESQDFIGFFMKTYQCEDNYGLVCGPWVTVLLRPN